MIAIPQDKLRPADEHHGYQFGIDGLCTVNQAMEFLGVGRSTIYRRIREGKLRKGKIGPITRICKRSLAEFANSVEE